MLAFHITILVERQHTSPHSPNVQYKQLCQHQIVQATLSASNRGTFASDQVIDASAPTLYFVYHEA
eukprot:2094866-Amphidinium_carterae.1